jgi:hypothetical protein
MSELPVVADNALDDDAAADANDASIGSYSPFSSPNFWSSFSDSDFLNDFLPCFFSHIQNFYYFLLYDTYLLFFTEK